MVRLDVHVEVETDVVHDALEDVSFRLVDRGRYLCLESMRELDERTVVEKETRSHQFCLFGRDAELWIVHGIQELHGPSRIFFDELLPGSFTLLIEGVEDPEPIVCAHEANHDQFPSILNGRETFGDGEDLDEFGHAPGLFGSSAI